MSIKKIEDYVYDFHKNCAEKQTRNDFWPAFLHNSYENHIHNPQFF